VISVVMPIFNGQRFVAQAMDSLLAQTFRDFEVIAVDDGSTDESPAILRRYAMADPRVRIIQSDHSGISAALNRGIEAATRPWIARIDADDVALPDRFAKQLTAAAANPSVVVWGSYAQHIDAAGKVLGISRTGPTSEDEFHRLREVGEDVYVIHPTSMLRRDVVAKVGGYDGQFNFCEDFELFDRMAEHGPIVALPEPLLLYRIHATSISMQRFFTMRRFANFVRARQKARLAGRVLTYEQFEQDARKRSLVFRAAGALHTSSGFYYRKSGLAAAEGAKLKAAAFLAASTVMNPAYAIPRVWNQVVSAKLHRLFGGESHSSSSGEGRNEAVQYPRVEYPHPDPLPAYRERDPGSVVAGAAATARETCCTS
jgi:glycosyltransferase involved in cell wall biosynthesis